MPKREDVVMKCHAMGTGQEYGRTRSAYVNESLCFGFGRHCCEQLKLPEQMPQFVDQNTLRDEVPPG